MTPEIEELRAALLGLLDATAHLTCEDVRLFHLPVDTFKLTMARIKALASLARLEQATEGEPVEFAQSSETEIPTISPAPSK